jgi:hypothetical protein
MMDLNEGVVGLLGVIGLFALIYTWCWIEGKLEGRMDRKRDEQRVVYDKWMHDQLKKR